MALKLEENSICQILSRGALATCPSVRLPTILPNPLTQLLDLYGIKQQVMPMITLASTITKWQTLNF
jgi:hypothetical protein